MAENNYYLSSSPHFTMKLSTKLVMLSVILALLPEIISGIVVFGFRALLVVLVAALSSVLFEFLFQIITKQKITVSNLSAALSGILLALVCPPTIPIWQVILGSAFSMIVAKGLFGGIGSNVFNPALIGRAFLFMSFPQSMGSNWKLPLRGKADLNSSLCYSMGITPDLAENAGEVTDALASATILPGIKKGLISASNFEWKLFFLGSRAGCIGETSILLILCSFIFLLICRIIDWRTTFSMVFTVFIASFIAALAKGNDLIFSLQSGLVSLMTGGLLFGAVFMATDYATSPVTKYGRLLFGFGCGLITFLIRTFGGYPEGVMFSILIMNAITPFLNNLTVRSYGYGKKGNRKPLEEKINREFSIKEGE